jgi:dTDP-4-amino-4,6-dideoxygalactose transaminase
MARLQQVLSSNRWFAGPRGDDPDSLGAEFGRRFAQMHGLRFGMPVSNGSVSLEIALKALGLEQGQEVIVPAYTFVSTATAVFMAGGVPVFADIDSRTYCLDPADAVRRISAHTKVLLPVHLGGHLADMVALGSLARQHGLLILEDAAQSIGAAWQGRKAGAWGQLGSFSFQANKTITSGEGGLIASDDEELAERVREMTAFGRIAGQGSAAGRSSALNSLRLSSNYRLSELQAAVLLAQMEKFPAQQERRLANAAYLSQGLGQIPGLTHVRRQDPELEHGYYYYLLRYEPACFGGLAPAELCRALNAEGAPFVPGDAHPIYRQPVFQPANLAGALCPQVLERYRQAVDPNDPGCPQAEEACRRTLILRHQVLLAQREDMDHILEALSKVQRHVQELI